jgi:hypothetical protein
MALFSQARPSSFLPPAGPRTHVQPTCTTRCPAPAWRTRRPTSARHRCSRAAIGHRAPLSSPPPSSMWHRPHQTSPLFPLRARSSRLSLTFLFPCSGIEAAESSTVVSSGARKTPHLSTPPTTTTTSPASHDLTRPQRPWRPLLHTEIAPEHRRPALFGELHPACHSSSIGSCLMIAYPRRFRRSLPEPPPATIRLLRHQAPSSRPASATSTPPYRVDKSPTMKPCPVGRLCAASALGVNTVSPSLPPHRRWLRRHGCAGHGDYATVRTHAVGWQLIAHPQAPTRVRLVGRM